jgi:peptide chain release factor 2
LERQKHAERLSEIAGAQMAVDFGSQIRSYVLQPYQQAKDLRSNVEIGNVEGVLDGDLDPLMEGYLRWERATAPSG